MTIPMKSAVCQSLAYVKIPSLTAHPTGHRARRRWAIDGAVRKLDNATADAVKARHELAGLVGSMRGQQKQFEQLFWTGLVALLLGLLISPIFARLLPFGLDGRMAAFIMHADRWDAGAALMEAQNPEAWRGLMDAS
jgi:Family of unknown function (DUF6118)